MGRFGECHKKLPNQTYQTKLTKPNLQLLAPGVGVRVGQFWYRSLMSWLPCLDICFCSLQSVGGWGGWGGLWRGAPRGYLEGSEGGWGGLGKGGFILILICHSYLCGMAACWYLPVCFCRRCSFSFSVLTWQTSQLQYTCKLNI